MQACNASHLQATDAELLAAFAAAQGLDSTALVQLAMTSFAAQLRVQIPHCPHCPLMQASAAPAENIIIGPWT